MPRSNGLQDATSKIRDLATHAERTYLQLAARRAWNLAQAATARGETWVEAGRMQPLSCGARAKLVIFKDGEVVSLRMDAELGTLKEEQLPALAEELFGAAPRKGCVVDDAGVYTVFRSETP